MYASSGGADRRPVVDRPPAFATMSVDGATPGILRGGSRRTGRLRALNLLTEVFVGALFLLGEQLRVAHRERQQGVNDTESSSHSDGSEPTHRESRYHTEFRKCNPFARVARVSQTSLPVRELPTELMPAGNVQW